MARLKRTLNQKEKAVLTQYGTKDQAKTARNIIALMDAAETDEDCLFYSRLSRKIIKMTERKYLHTLWNIEQEFEVDFHLEPEEDEEAFCSVSDLEPITEDNLSIVLDQILGRK